MLRKKRKLDVGRCRRSREGAGPSAATAKAERLHALLSASLLHDPQSSFVHPSLRRLAPLILFVLGHTMPTVSRRPQGAPPSEPRRHLIAPHHQFYVGSLLAVVATFTLLSLVFQTHAYNVSLSKIPSAPLEPHLKPVASVFARKSNIINRWFIKKAWLWTTLAHLAQLLTLRAPPTPEAKLAASRARGKKKVDSDDEASSAEEGAPEDQAATVTSPFAKSLLRWFIATLCWL